MIYVYETETKIGSLVRRRKNLVFGLAGWLAGWLVCWLVG